MSIPHQLISSASSALTTPAGSLQQFARVGALLFGVVSGSVAVAGQASAREAAYKAAISERDAQIASLTSAKKTLEMEKTGQAEKPSSGDPVQDWIDSLAE